VCKFIDAIQDIIDNGTLPVDFSTATCIEYMPSDLIEEVEDDEPMSDEEVAQLESMIEEAEQISECGSILSVLTETVVEVSRTMKPIGLHLNSSTLVVLLWEIGYDTQNLTSMEKLPDIQIGDHRLKVFVEENIKSGMFHITVDKGRKK
jgi:hypothetical protein